MNKIIKISIIIVFLFGNLSAQNEDSNLSLKSIAEEPNCEYLSAMLDYLLIDVQNEPNSVGYTIIFGNSDIINNEIYKHSVIGHSKLRGASQSRYKILTAKTEGKLRIEVWLSKNGEKPKYEEYEFTMQFPDTTRPISFAKDMFHIVNIDGRTTYLTYACEVCCMDSFNPYLLSTFLEANPNLNAEIKIYAKKKKLAETVKEIMIKEDLKESDISLDRINFKLGKNPTLTDVEKDWFSVYFDRTSKEKFAIIEVNLVSKNSIK